MAAGTLFMDSFWGSTGCIIGTDSLIFMSQRFDCRDLCLTADGTSIFCFSCICTGSSNRSSFLPDMRMALATAVSLAGSCSVTVVFPVMSEGGSGFFLNFIGPNRLAMILRWISAVS